MTRKAEVKKKKKKRKKNGYLTDSDDDLDDFIVHDDEDEDDNQPSLSDLEQLLSPRKSQKRVALTPTSSPSRSKASDSSATVVSSPANVFDPLTNLILLVGPVGSGKSSTVYAVAKELGYQVFEVSPGSGKRSYKDLLQAVGDVGQNHIVWKKAASAMDAKGSLQSFFGGAAKAAKSSSEGSSAGPAAANGPSSSKVTQSLILIEEADILFEDDKSHGSFWDGTSTLLREKVR